MSSQLKQKDFWSGMWPKVERGTFFDLAGSTPPLIRLVKSGVLPEGTTLVPGCGRGYDCIALSDGKKRIVTGLDIVENAVKEAEKFREELKIDSNQVKYVNGDFFKFLPEDGKLFNVIYDYTFLCALPPDLRKNWAKKMKSLIAPETGRLVTLIFPIVEKEGGPPYAMTIKLVSDLLQSEGFEQTYIEKIVKDSHSTRKGKEALVIWKLPKGE